MTLIRIASTWWAVTAPTCTEDGYITFTCSVCEDSYTEAGESARGHDYQSTVTAPTCTEQGYTTHTCHCGDTYKDKYTAAIGHDYQEKFDDTKHWKQCKNCSAVINEANHSWNNTYSTDAEKHWIGCAGCAAKKGEGDHDGGIPSCTELAICYYCNQPYGETIPHSYTMDIATKEYQKTAESCTQEGVYYWSCICGATNGTTFTVPMLDHDWNDFYISTSATHYRQCKNCTKRTDEGSHYGGKATCVAKAKCSVCERGYGELGNHQYTKEDQTHLYRAADCLNPAVYHHSCEVCGGKGTTTYIYGSALGHDWSETHSSDHNGHWIDCGRCGEKKENRAHSYGEYVHLIEATCYQNGKDQRTCNVCSYVETTELPMLSHEMYGPTVIREGPKANPATGEQVYYHYTCYACVNYEYCKYRIDSGVVVEHAHPCETIPGYPSTCTETGLNPGIFCIEPECGFVSEPHEVTPALGHEYQDGFCIRCKEPEVVYSEGLSFTISADGTYYILTGIGTCADTDIVIPVAHEGYPVKGIGANALYNQNHLTSVTIPETVESIGASAFESCAGLTAIWVHEDNRAYCSDSSGVLFDKAMTTLIAAPGKLTGDYVVPNGVTTIEASAFFETAIGGVTLPSTLETIGDYAFGCCENLLCADLNNGLTTIGMEAFGSCTSLRDIQIPASVGSIGEMAFTGCDSMNGIWVNSGNGNYASDAMGVLFSKDMTTLIAAPGALSGSYTIPAGTQMLDMYSMINCIRLTELTIPASVTYIGPFALRNANYLESIYFEGTEDDWNAIYKGSNWNTSTGSKTANGTYTLICCGDM